MVSWMGRGRGWISHPSSRPPFKFSSLNLNFFSLNFAGIKTGIPR